MSTTLQKEPAAAQIADVVHTRSSPARQPRPHTVPYHPDFCFCICFGVLACLLSLTYIQRISSILFPSSYLSQQFIAKDNAAVNDELEDTGEDSLGALPGKIGGAPPRKSVADKGRSMSMPASRKKEVCIGKEQRAA